VFDSVKRLTNISFSTLTGVHKQLVQLERSPYSSVMVMHTELYRIK